MAFPREDSRSLPRGGDALCNTGTFGGGEAKVASARVEVADAVWGVSVWDGWEPSEENEKNAETEGNIGPIEPEHPCLKNRMPFPFDMQIFSASLQASTIKWLLESGA